MVFLLPCFAGELFQDRGRETFSEKEKYLIKGIDRCEMLC